MDSREECEQIISAYNGRALPNSSQALVVKFADGGSSKRKTNVASPEMYSGHASTDGSVSFILMLSSVVLGVSTFVGERCVLCKYQFKFNQIFFFQLRIHCGFQIHYRSLPQMSV